MEQTSLAHELALVWCKGLDEMASEGLSQLRVYAASVNIPMNDGCIIIFFFKFLLPCIY